MEFEVRWTGVPGNFDAELWEEESGTLITSVGGQASLAEVNAWARREAAEWMIAQHPQEQISGTHNFTL